MEMRLALEWLRLPYRYAFSLSLAFQSVDILSDEWQAIKEAQLARGVELPNWAGWRQLPSQAEQLVALSVPAIVLTTKRAWTMTEAAYARGFDAPHRTVYRRLAVGWRDGVMFGLTLGVVAVLVVWPFSGILEI
jgi:energy-coupling factor transport system permease protein